MMIYDGWHAVPHHMLTATQLGELEYPRKPAEKPHAYVDIDEDWSGRKATIALYDARFCRPTGSTARQLDAASQRGTRVRVCTDCSARYERPLSIKVDDRLICPRCLYTHRLRRAQRDIITRHRPTAVVRARNILAIDGLAVICVETHNPGRTASGKTRPDAAVTVSAVDTNGSKLVGVTVSLVGQRSRFWRNGAMSKKEGAAVIHGALAGRTMVAWKDSEIRTVMDEFHHPSWQMTRSDLIAQKGREISTLSRWWYGQLDERLATVEPLSPGTPDRILHHLGRIAGSMPLHHTEMIMDMLSEDGQFPSTLYYSSGRCLELGSDGESSTD